MAKTYFVIDLSDDIMEEFGTKTGANNYITGLLSTTGEDKIIVIYGEELNYDVKAFIRKES